MLRIKVGGRLAIQNDFEEALRRKRSSRLDTELGKGSQRQEDLALIPNAIRCRLKAITKDERNMSVHLCATLYRLRETTMTTCILIASVEENTPKPFLVPRSMFLPDVKQFQIVRFPLIKDILHLAYFECGTRTAV